MPFHAVCPECSAPAEFADEVLDRQLRCRRCGAVVAVSRTAHAAEPTPGADSPRGQSEQAKPSRWSLLLILGIAVASLGLVAAGFGAVLLVKHWYSAPAKTVVRLEDLQEEFFPHNLANLPPLSPARQVAPGIVVHKVSWTATPPAHLYEPQDPFAPFPQPTDSVKRRVWIYLPEKAAGRLPVVLIAPAGSPLVIGMDLSKDDQAERLPYVRAGFAVVAYSIDGSVPNFEHLPLERWLPGMRAFVHADGGRENARLALDYALARVPSLDPERVYTAGHSSAGTLSLLVAEHEPRIKGSVAYAPVTNIARQPAGLNLIAQVQRLSLGAGELFVSVFSPLQGAPNLHCPVFLFHAQDDPVVNIAQSDDFVAALERTNSHVKYVRGQSGGHSMAMFTKGIPQAITWLKQQAGMR